MSKVKIEGNASGTGTLTIAAPNTNTDRTLTLPDGAGELLTDASDSVQGYAFSAYAVTANALSAATLTKVNFDTELFDTDSCYDTSTSRFTPTKAGYYQINASCTGSAVSTGIVFCSIYKNGSEFKRGVYSQYSGSGTKVDVSGLVYCNGSTDYIEIYFHVPQAMNTYTGTSAFTWFDGFLARNA